jgi:drug/metabolite transporter (DMT)-like permease
MAGPRAYDYAVLAIGILAVSTAAILIRQAEAPSLVIAAYRLVLAAVPMVAFTVYRREHLVPKRGERAVLTLLAGVALALHFVFWIESVKQTSIITSVVLVSTAPLFVALASGPLLGERPSKAVWYALAITVAGTMVMVGEDFGEGSDTVRGDLFALLGAALAAVFMLIGRRMLATEGRWLPYSTATYGVAAVILVAIVAIAGEPITGFSDETYVYLVLLALVPQIIGHTALNRSLGYLPAVAVALAVQGEPVGSTVLAATLLGEIPTAFELAGGALVLAGVYVGLRPSRTSQPAASLPSPRAIQREQDDHDGSQEAS